MSLELNVSVGIAVLVMLVFFIYYFYHVSRTYGGKIRNAFFKLSSGIGFIILSVVVMGIIIRLDMLCGEATSAPIMLSALLPALIGTALILLGARELAVT